MSSNIFGLLLSLILCIPVLAIDDTFGVHKGLHFVLQSRGTNIDGSYPLYKNPNAPIKERVNDLLPRMTIEEKVSQMCVAFVYGLLEPTTTMEIFFFILEFRAI